MSVKIGTSIPTISRWETGDRFPRPEDVSAMLTAVGADPRRREQLVELARYANPKQWLSLRLADRELMMMAFLEYERCARRIVYAAPLLVPGLLQTSGYTRAIMTTGGLSPAEAESRVRVRAGRREVLTKPTPVELLALIGEAALRHEIGGPPVLLHQLKYLAACRERANIDLRVLPDSAGWTPLLTGPFMLLEDHEGQSVVQLEYLVSGALFHLPEDVDAYREAVPKLVEAALSPADSAQFIARRTAELEAKT